LIEKKTKQFTLFSMFLHVIDDYFRNKVQVYCDQ